MEEEEQIPASQVMNYPTTSASQRDHGKDIRDTIHGHIGLSSLTVAALDTPEVQRLRELRQLGPLHYVWPTATHTRLEHSIGVAYLARQSAQHLLQLQRLEGHDNVTHHDTLLVELAGLCHDIGHGPFSHSFEKFLTARGKLWKHEQMSAMLVERVVQNPALAKLTHDDVNKVLDMIMASEHKGQSKGWLFDIVANGRNGLDVDKFDYLERDSRSTGFRISSDFQRIQRSSKVIGDEICYKWDNYDNVLQILKDRTRLHQQVYNHRKAKGIELMIIDILMAADQVMHFTDDVDDPAQFLGLNDSILQTIEQWGRWHKGHPSCEDRNMLRAQALLKRLRNREIYKYCNEILVPQNQLNGCRALEPTPDEIKEYVRGVHVDSHDIIVSSLNIGMTAGSQNPMDRVHFYDHADSTVKRKLRPDQVSDMLPAAFEECKIRVYCKKYDRDMVDAIHKAVEEWGQYRFGEQHISATPRPNRRGCSPSASMPDAKRSRRALNLNGITF